MIGQGFDLLVVVLFGILLICLAPGRGGLARALGTEIPYRLGQWSYSIYLIHDKFSHPAGSLQQLLAKYIPFASVVTLVFMAGLVIACSAASFRWIERPAGNYLRATFRFASTPRRVPPATAERRDQGVVHAAKAARLPIVATEMREAG